MPKLLAIVQLADFNKIKAKVKLIRMVVKVRKKLIPACCHFLYEKLKSGKAFSINQKIVIPLTRIKLLWEEGIEEK
jgi:hypothetical protein